MVVVVDPVPGPVAPVTITFEATTVKVFVDA